MITKWTKQDKDNGIYPAVGTIVKAVLGLHDEVEINVRGYSIDYKMVFGQDVKNELPVICNFDWLHPVETAREKYDREMLLFLENMNTPEKYHELNQLNFSYRNGLIDMYEKLKPFQEKS